MKLHIHHYHHLDDEDRELLIVQNELLASLSEDIKMISAEVQGLLDQSIKANTTLASLDARFKAQVLQIADLQTTVNNLRVGSVMTDAEKQQLVTAASELAANVSNAQADILANTPDAPPATDPSSPPASTGTGTDTSGGTGAQTGTGGTGGAASGSGTDTSGSGSQSASGGATQNRATGTDPNAPPAAQ